MSASLNYEDSLPVSGPSGSQGRLRGSRACWRPRRSTAWWKHKPRWARSCSTAGACRVTTPPLSAGSRSLRPPAMRRRLTCSAAAANWGGDCRQISRVPPSATGALPRPDSRGVNITARTCCCVGAARPRDRAMALALYRRAGAQGHAKSLNMVGRFIEEGWEMPANPQGAADLYRRAAAAGDFRGQYNLASVLARDGKIDQAAAWLDRVLETATTEFLATMAGRLAGSGDARLRSIAAVAARRARDGAGQPCGSSMRALPNSVANGSQLN